MRKIVTEAKTALMSSFSWVGTSRFGGCPENSRGRFFYGEKRGTGLRAKGAQKRVGGDGKRRQEIPVAKRNRAGHRGKAREVLWGGGPTS